MPTVNRVEELRAEFDAWWTLYKVSLNLNSYARITYWACWLDAMSWGWELSQEALRAKA